MRERWSNSKLTTLNRCGERFRRREIEKEYAPTTSSMARGTSVHAVAAESHMRQIAARAADPGRPKSVVLSEALPSLAEAGDLAAAKFEEQRDRMGVVAPSDDAKVDAAEKVIGRDKDTAVRMSQYYVTRVAPFLDPIYVEREITVEPADSDIAIRGTLDLGTIDAQGVETLRDIKTSEGRPQKHLADDSQQLTLYALLRKLETGKIPDRVALDYVVAERKAFTPVYLVTLESKRTQADLDVVVSRINNAISAVRSGVFLANGPGNWWCSPKWCPYHPTCPYVRQP